MSFLSFEMTELDQNIFDTVILEHPVHLMYENSIVNLISKITGNDRDRKTLLQ